MDCGFSFKNRSVSGIKVSGSSSKGSYTDKSQYIPLIESIRNLMSGASVKGSSGVNLVTSKDFDFQPGDKAPKGYKAYDGLLRMDIADVAQMQRDLQERIEKIESEMKSSEARQNLFSAREAVKNGEKVSEKLLKSIGDVNLSKLIESYNNTIQ